MSEQVHVVTDLPVQTPRFNKKFIAIAAAATAVTVAAVIVVKKLASSEDVDSTDSADNV